MGPTASGKTGLAVDWVERFPLEIISVDSALVYRGMDIGTAKPDASVLSRAPHRLINIREPEQSYSAADFCADAQREMAQITAAGCIPLLVGGTMLYFRALLEGLAALPSASPELRQQFEQRIQTEGLQVLYEQLSRQDPVAAERINANDAQRIQRALEVIELTGRPLSELQAESEGEALNYHVLRVVINPAERRVLHERIERRFDLMLEQGFEEEVKRLAGRPGFDPELPAMRAVGYRQAWPWLAGEYDRERWRELSIFATRQLAKRQVTWLRRERTALWYDPGEEAALEALDLNVRKFLET